MKIDIDYQTYVAACAALADAETRDKHLATIADKWKQARKNLKSAWMAEIDAIDIRPALLKPQAG